MGNAMRGTIKGCVCVCACSMEDAEQGYVPPDSVEDDENDLWVLVKARQSASEEMEAAKPGEYFTADTLRELDAPRWASMVMEHGGTSLSGKHNAGRWVSDYIAEDGSWLLLGRVSARTIDGAVLTQMVERGLFPEVSLGVEVGMPADRDVIRRRVAEISFTEKGERGVIEGDKGRTPVLGFMRAGPKTGEPGRRCIEGVLRASYNSAMQAPGTTVGAAGNPPALNPATGQPYVEKAADLVAMSRAAAEAASADVGKVAEKRPPTEAPAATGTEPAAMDTTSAAPGEQATKVPRIAYEASLADPNMMAVVVQEQRIRGEAQKEAELARTETANMLKQIEELKKQNASVMQAAMGNEQEKVKALITAYINHLRTVAPDTVDDQRAIWDGVLAQANAATNPIDAIGKVHRQVEGIVRAANITTSANADLNQRLAQEAQARLLAEEKNTRLAQAGLLFNEYRQRAGGAVGGMMQAGLGARPQPVQQVADMYGAGAQSQQQQQQQPMQAYNTYQSAEALAERLDSDLWGGAAKAFVKKVKETQLDVRFDTTTIEDQRRRIGPAGVQWAQKMLDNTRVSGGDSLMEHMGNASVGSYYYGM